MSFKSLSVLSISLILSTSAIAGLPKAQPADPMTDGFDVKIAQQLGKQFGRVMEARHKVEGGAYKRPVFLKPHACAKATFTIENNLPPELQKGLFKTPKTHSAWVRFSSDTSPGVPDASNNTLGFGLKVLDVPGKKVLKGEEDFTTHDFLLQNHPFFFSDTAKDFMEFIDAVLSGKQAGDKYLADHPVTAQILDSMKKPVGNVLNSPYWSTTPYKFAQSFAKYKIVPCETREDEKPSTEANYLRDRLARDLKDKGACFKLQVQLRTDAESMPLDKATVEWSEAKSAPHTVATISIPAQTVDASNDECENMSFTAWHALPEHAPVGTVNQARGFVYKMMADMRRTKNNVPIAEPKE